MKGSSAGIAAIWVIIMVTSVVILVPLAVLAFNQLSETQEQWDNLKLLKESLEKEEKELQAKLKDLLPATGMGMGEDGKLPDQKAGKFRDTWRQTLMPIDPGSTDYSTISNFAKRLNNSTIYYNISELCQLAMFRVALAKQLQIFFAERKKIVEQRVKVIEGLKPGYNDHPEKLLPKIQQWMVEVQQKMQKDNEQFLARKQAIEAEMEAIRQVVEDEPKKHERVMARLKKEWDEQMSHFKTLLKTRDQVDFAVGRQHVQGHLVAPDIQNRICWIDIGSKHRVVNGMHFLVGKRGEKNNFSYKAEIEVKQVYFTSAECEIMKVFDHDVPVVDGDIIINAMMHKYRPLVLVLSGADKPPGHTFSIGEAKRRLVEYGNEVLEVVDTRCDILLWTDYKPGESEFTPEYWKAVELGIPIAKAKDLYKFLGD
jgi:hypothetical protein